MPQPSFLSTDAPRRSDTLWFRWVRILSQYQNQVGADPDNNASRLDTIRQLKYKVLKAVRGANGITDASLVLSENPDNALEWTWNQTDPTSWSVQQTDTPDMNWVEILTPVGSARNAVGMTLFKWYRVVAVGGDFDGEISNTVFIG